MFFLLKLVDDQIGLVILLIAAAFVLEWLGIPVIDPILGYVESQIDAVVQAVKGSVQNDIIPW
jgi:Co/Zn/Cd efflux system component